MMMCRGTRCHEQQLVVAVAGHATDVSCVTTTTIAPRGVQSKGTRSMCSGTFALERTTAGIKDTANLPSGGRMHAPCREEEVEGGCSQNQAGDHDETGEKRRVIGRSGKPVGQTKRVTVLARVFGTTVHSPPGPPMPARASLISCLQECGRCFVWNIFP